MSLDNNEFRTELFSDLITIKHMRTIEDVYIFLSLSLSLVININSSSFSKGECSRSRCFFLIEFASSSSSFLAFPIYIFSLLSSRTRDFSSFCFYEEKISLNKKNQDSAVSRRSLSIEYIRVLTWDKTSR